ncbi:flavonoid 3-hydroxylase, putative [Talaromyces stipitatus ATCC 10500]|uniref:Flavonoid 3-hydroxylase, putative n=1 Tax=Talaromyces stipitatus (strain ATCC 10500 / CBS 375.48 / QM 6759 / NRRL 1006) TaxID=441959 RepID=B8LZP4_TALSN|nr:flavonoid 3-hydroxylase, putative [Talaromyces stipitatus ATCC 10500]EED22467.1 flavonoid 3-hydroxylase, putative [Talaromyces stipitatus ATCC 10500]
MDTATIISDLSPVSLGVAIVSALVGALLYGIGLVIYRLTLHPLAKFPGPKVAAATKWYEFYFDCIKSPGGQFLWETYRMHEKYGPIVRINPDELQVADPDWYDTLNAAGGAIRHKYPPAANLVGTPLGVFGTIDHHVHRIRKAPVASYFGRGSVIQSQSVLRSGVEELSDRFHQLYVSGDTINLRATLLAFATDLLAIYGFGGSLGISDSEEKVMEFMHTMNAVAVVTPFFKQFPDLLPWLFMLKPWMVKLIYPAVLPMLKLHRVRIPPNVWRWKDADMSEEKPEALTQYHPSDIFDGILNSNLPEHEKSVDRLSQDAFLAITAGSDPIARTVAIGTYYLLVSPDNMKLLQDELDTVMPDRTKLPELLKLETLPFLVAVVKETMRIVGLAASRLPLISETPMQYKEWVIPARTPVGMSIHQVMHDKKYFPDPDTFRPRRWLEKREDGVQLEKYYVPFGRGTRMCVGQHFAQAEIYLVMAAIFRRFNLQLVDTDFKRDIETVRDCFLTEARLESQGIRIKVVGERP